MMTNLSFEDSLRESLHFSFIDKNIEVKNSFAPKVLTNNALESKFVLTDLQEELAKCRAFYFVVAFVSKSGLALIKTQLSDLADKNIKGKIIISPYLDFNDPTAMEEFLKLKNVEVRLSPKESNLHSKYYLFEQGYKEVLISGSSNLTASALKINCEWNIKLTSTSEGEIISKTREDFNRLWQISKPLTKDLIEKYAKERKVRQIVSQPLVANKTITSNSMQERAIDALDSSRKKGETKALIISATGTGKTYLSALDVKNYKPKKVLFLVHREQILSKALESFKQVLNFEDGEAIIYKAGLNRESKYIFATIQTLSREEHLRKFAKDEFDYIIIDEVHKAGADSYKKVIDYFNPKFLLGMTATPERTDKQNIYELFDYNVAYEIRLQEALENDLLCPFIYYGVTDISIDGKLLDENESFDRLVSEERLRHIINKVDYYGYSGDKVRGLIFCSSKREAYRLSEQLNKYSYKTQALSGDDSQTRREEVVRMLEEGQLDYIITVDIFNEGIDIPSINQVVMLRNTQSSIVFVQQLGRGLRKHDSKEYVTIIDFIGNYKNNYLIPIALFGDNSMNKDNYRRLLMQSAALQGLTTINFEEIAKEQIFKSITSTNLSNMKILRDAYIELENRLGRRPYLVDFLESNSLDVASFFDKTAFKNYAHVVSKFSSSKIILSNLEEVYLSFMTFELLSGKRKQELILLAELIKNKGILKKEKYLNLLKQENLSRDELTIRSVERILNLSFLKQMEVKKYGQVPLVSLKGDTYYLNEEINKSIKEKKEFRYLFFDVIAAALIKSKNYPDIFTLGQKYSRREVLKYLNISKDEPALKTGGYKIDKETNTCPIFVTYNKSELTFNKISYDNEFINNTHLVYFSKNKRNISSPDVSYMIDSENNNLRFELFVIKDNSEAREFYYLGPMTYVKDSAREIIVEGDSLVRMLFALKKPVEESLFKYLTNK
ncbi:DEAD/DEAH box helicase [Gemella sp. GL1.1]|nr:DEAD/DEAH box helicase [Gemella sp. GL1.1]NYS27997.1 DEAD/DEAH box helicase [Gemella sp. GL1]